MNWWSQLQPWLSQNILDVAQTMAIIVGLIMTIIEFRTTIKTNYLSTDMAITQSHREIWKETLSDPELSRFYSVDVDLNKNPVSFRERIFVYLLMSHVNFVYKAHKYRTYPLKRNEIADVGNFFTLPIPSFVWQTELKKLYDKEFIKFVDQAINMVQNIPKKSYFETLRENVRTRINSASNWLRANRDKLKKHSPKRKNKRK